MESLPVIQPSPQSPPQTGLSDFERKERNVLVFNYTMACPLKCDFCCYGCHPRRTEKMPESEAARLIGEAGKLGVFSSIGFTGGEPMLFAEEIVRLSRIAKDEQLSITIATAGHWGETCAEAQHWISQLAEAGLNRLNISHDPSHAQFVSRRAIIHIAVVASSFGIPTYIVGTFYEPGQSLKPMFPEIIDLPHVAIVDKYVAKVGRAARRSITQAGYGLKLDLDQLACYRQIHHDVVVFYDGRVYPCCSTFNRATEGICVGNAFEEPLESLWRKIDGSLMLRIMKRQGFGKLYEVIEQYDPDLFAELPRAEVAVGPCSLCNAIFSDPQITSRIKAVFERYESSKILAILDLVQEIAGEEVMSRVIESVISECVA